METYQTSKMLTPRAGIPPLVEIPQQQNEAHERSDEAARADEPPRPPQGLAALEEAERGFCEVGELRGDFAARGG